LAEKGEARTEMGGRLKKIANAQDLHFDSYHYAEQYFLDAAHSAGLNGWELDRLLYHATDEVLGEIKAGGRCVGKKR
jgi:hypothetical protein